MKPLNNKSISLRFSHIVNMSMHAASKVKELDFFHRSFIALIFIIFYLFITSFFNSAFANTLITNAATANFTINGTSHQLSDSVQFTKDAVVTPSDTITLSKNVNVNQVFTGDIVSYTLTVSNPNTHSLNNVIIQDTLPTGLVYQTGTAKLNNVNLIASKVALLGTQLTFTLGNIPPNTTWSIDYDIKADTTGIAINKAIARSDTADSLPVQAIINITLRTPSTIKFLKINDSGVNSILPPSSYNDDQNGGKNWQLVNTVTLADGSVITLPTPQPLIDATQYTLFDPVIIEVTDLDQNTSSSVIDTIIVEVTVTGTNDKEILLLQETAPNSGVFRGVLLTTSNATQLQDGQLSLQEGSEINVSYRDKDDNTDNSISAALVVPDTKMSLSKVANKETASLGELVRYTLKFSNTNNFTITNLKLKDSLPLGFRYIANTAKLNGVNINTGISHNGRSLQFDLGTMAVGQTWTVEYLTKITAGVQIGKAINTAIIDSDNYTSNKAQATILIKDDLMRSKNILTGRVVIGCKKNEERKYLKDARIYDETGRSVLSDADGFWHMEGVEAGTRVLQIDKFTLPDGYEPVLCQDNTRHAGSAESQFINLQAGTLWHQNFYVVNTNNIAEKKSEPKLSSKPNLYYKPNPENSHKLDLPKENEALKVENPLKRFDKEYLKIAPEGFEILWPPNDYVPSLASIKILVKSSPHHKVNVFFNGKLVNPLNYDGSDTNKARTITIKRWVGIDLDIKNKNNSLLVIYKDKSGKELSRQTRNIHFSGNAASAEFLPDESVLIADGKTIPIIAIRLKDEDGFPMRANTYGYFTLENSRFQVRTLNENKGSLDLNEPLAGSYKYLIKKGGIAKIELNPTTQSGEIKLNLQFTNTKSKSIRAWLKPQLRDWILVGLAEGTLSHKTLSGNMKTLDDLDKDEAVYKRGRFAFFAKGKIKGKYLLTVAYDTHKTKQKSGSQLEGNIDPDAWYTVYADNSNSQYNAPSSKKLYLKIEKENFYTVFGDYRANMNVTELAKYERVLNGIKSEYQSKRLSYNAFISETRNKHHHDEIPGDGTSGLYHLKHDIITNSETIKLEVRDRFHAENIVKSQVLSRYQDYDIDYATGTLFFKFPIAGRDQNFNPQIIVVDYDSEANSNKEIVAGGRIAAKTENEKLEIGASALLLNRRAEKDDSLIALDANYKITPNTKLRVEIAQSKTKANQYQTVNAEIIELEKQIKDLEAKIYYRKQGGNFGIDAQKSETATQKVGAGLNYKINDKTRVHTEISQQKNLSNENLRQHSEINITHKRKQLELSSGLRRTKENLDNASGSKAETNYMLLTGARYTTKNGKVTYRADIEQGLNKVSSSERSPNRKVVGVELKINNGMQLFAEHEVTDNHKTKTQNSRVGVSQSLWKGAKAKTAYTHERNDQGQRNYATLGLSQNIKINKHLSADISIDHAKTMGNTQKPFNQNEPPPQGSQRDDYTAFSVGLGSHIKDWGWTSRFELRDGELSDKINLRFGLIHHLKNGRQVNSKFNYTDTKHSNGGFEKSTKLSFGIAWHPKEKDFVFFSQLDLIDDQSATNNDKSHTQKIIHNMHYNRKINDKTQISVHHGIKHVIDKSFDKNKGTKHNATIDTGTVSIRKDINKKWDIGAKIGYLHDWTGKTTEAVAGVSIGMTPAKNAWIELGYNVEGFDDEDFDNNVNNSDYKRKGAYTSFRYKFNQNSFDGKDLPIRRQSKQKKANNNTDNKKNNNYENINNIL